MSDNEIPDINYVEKPGEYVEFSSVESILLAAKYGLLDEFKEFYKTQGIFCFVDTWNGLSENVSNIYLDELQNIKFFDLIDTAPKFNLRLVTHIFESENEIDVEELCNIFQEKVNEELSERHSPKVLQANFDNRFCHVQIEYNKVITIDREAINRKTVVYILIETSRIADNKVRCDSYIIDHGQSDYVTGRDGVNNILTYSFRNVNEFEFVISHDLNQINFLRELEDRLTQELDILGITKRKAIRIGDRNPDYPFAYKAKKASAIDYDFEELEDFIADLEQYDLYCDGVSFVVTNNEIIADIIVEIRYKFMVNKTEITFEESKKCEETQLSSCIYDDNLGRYSIDLYRALNDVELDIGRIFYFCYILLKIIKDIYPYTD